jgi:hypothetical protein
MVWPIWAAPWVLAAALLLRLFGCDDAGDVAHHRKRHADLELRDDLLRPAT